MIEVAKCDLKPGLVAGNKYGCDRISQNDREKWECMKEKEGSIAPSEHSDV